MTGLILTQNTSIPRDLLIFIRSSITSIWTLELILFLMRNKNEVWSVDQLVRELRGSKFLVVDILGSLLRAGLVVEEAVDAFRYRPATAKADDLVLRLERLSGEKPLAVRNAIISAPHDGIQGFADAFRIKKE